MIELSRPVALDRLGGAGFDMVVEASEAECSALAERMKIPTVRRLRCVFRLRRLAEAIFEADGVLEAEVEQVCVVSSEQFGQAVAETFTVQFVPAGTEAADDDLEAPDQIPYSGNSIDLGEAAAQQLALALDPYPRMPGLPELEAEETSSPFAGLAGLRRTQ